MPSARTLFSILSVVLPAALGLALPVSAPVSAQGLADGTQALNAALTRLASNPRDADALIDAGGAALAMGDAEAAIGFFSRAQEVAPGNARAKAGLASAHVHNEDPFTAISLFAEAARAGPLSAPSLVDQGLAYDLVGDNASAQRFYRAAGPRNDEALRRLALSLAIAGDKRGSEAALAPLLGRQDKSAWRVRAFSLAILGETDQAVSISKAMLPAGLASAITPYLRYMGQLTRAQQAAAANLGHFPRASEIGRDDPRIALYSRPTARPAAKGVDAGLIPAGEQLGKKTTQRQESNESNRKPKRQSKRERERELQASRERERPPEPIVATRTTSAAAPSPAPAVPAPVVAAPAAPAPVTAPAAPALAAAPAARATAPTAATPLLATAAAPKGILQGPSFELLPSNSSQPPAKPAPPAAPAAEPASLADAFSEFNRPTISTTPAPGAVDVRKITAAKPAPPKVAKPEPPAQPSRIWVQVATGQDKRALAFDWRKMSRQNAAVFKSRKAYVTGWNQTNRLLTGPFKSEAEAKEFMNLVRKEDIAGAFLWTSPAGQVVDELSGTK